VKRIAYLVEEGFEDLNSGCPDAAARGRGNRDGGRTQIKAVSGKACLQATPDVTAKEFPRRLDAIVGARRLGADKLRRYREVPVTGEWIYRRARSWRLSVMLARC